MTGEKEKAKVIRKGKGFEVLSVPAYTGTKKSGTLTLQGHSQVTVPTEDENGLAFVRKNLTAADVIDIRRQRITDVKNGIRPAGEITLSTKIKRAVKSKPELQARLEKILAEMEA